MKFELDERELKLFNEWYDKHPCKGRYAGAIGGSITWHITRTSIGTVLTANCGFPDCKDNKLDLSFYDEW